jgi:hypothetical protein
MAYTPHVRPPPKAQLPRDVASEEWRVQGDVAFLEPIYCGGEKEQLYRTGSRATFLGSVSVLWMTDELPEASG